MLPQCLRVGCYHSVKHTTTKPLTCTPARLYLRETQRGEAGRHREMMGEFKKGMEIQLEEGRREREKTQEVPPQLKI